MDAERSNRVTRLLANAASRRRAFRLLGAVGTVAAGASAADAKQRCKKRLRACGGNKDCCNGGVTACRMVNGTRKLLCADYSDRVCCGKEGTPCDPDNHSCDCCGDLTCRGNVGDFRCRLVPSSEGIVG